MTPPPVYVYVSFLDISDETLESSKLDALQFLLNSNEHFVAHLGHGEKKIIHEVTTKHNTSVLICKPTVQANTERWLDCLRSSMKRSMGS